MNRRDWIKLLAGAALAPTGALAADTEASKARFDETDWLSLGRRAFRCKDTDFIADIFYVKVLTYAGPILDETRGQFRVVLHNLGSAKDGSPRAILRREVESPTFRLDSSEQREMSAKATWCNMMQVMREAVDPQEIHRYHVVDGCMFPNPSFPHGVDPPEVIEGTKATLEYANKYLRPIRRYDN